MPSKLPPFFLRLRFATAAIATWLMNLGMFGQRFKLHSLCTPGFDCHGCPWATAACPIGAIAYGSAIHSIPVFAIASVLAVGAILGRLVCSFACPMGFLQDLLYRLPGPKIRLPRWFGYGKYAALVLLVLVLPWVFGFQQTGYLAVSKPGVDKGQGGSIDVKVTITNPGMEPVKDPQVIAVYREQGTGKEIYRVQHDFPDVTVSPGQKDIQLPIFQVPNNLATADLEVTSPQSEVGQTSPYQLYYCRLCPTGTLMATIPSFFNHDASRSIYARAAGMSLRLGILAVFIILMVASSRPLCRLFCPLGAIYALTNRLSLSGMKLDSAQCIDCKQCDKVCPMSLDVRKEVGGAECIACGDCMKVCPKNGIRRTFGL